MLKQWLTLLIMLSLPLVLHCDSLSQQQLVAHKQSIQNIIQYVIKSKYPPSIELRQDFWDILYATQQSTELSILKNEWVGRELTWLLLTYLDTQESLAKKTWVKSKERQYYEHSLLKQQLINEDDIYKMADLQKRIMRRHKSKETQAILNVLIQTLKKSQANIDLLFMPPSHKEE